MSLLKILRTSVKPINCQFLTQKNDFGSTSIGMFEEVVHNFDKSDNDMI